MASKNSSSSTEQTSTTLWQCERCNWNHKIHKDEVAQKKHDYHNNRKCPICNSRIGCVYIEGKEC